MILRNVFIRGSIGLFRGLGKEELKVNFEDIPPGIISLVGRNGMGKTTFMENLTPFRQMPSRGEKVISSFYLPNSVRDLSFSYQGEDYRCLFKIDGKEGKGNYFLYKNETPLNDGSATTYDAAVTELFGSSDMFFKTIFLSQGSRKISSWTKGERKDLFTELLGLQKMQTMSLAAREKAGEVKIRLQEVQKEISENKEKLEEGKNLFQELEETKESLQRIEGREEGFLEEKKEMEEDLEELRTKVQSQEMHEQELEHLYVNMETLRTTLQREKRQFENQQQTLQTRQERMEESLQEYQEVLQRKDEILAGEAKLKELQDEGILEESEEKLEGIVDQLNQIKESITKSQAQVETLKKDITKLEQFSESLKGLPCEEELQGKCPLAEDVRSSVQDLEKCRKSEFETLKGLSSLEEEKDRLQSRKQELEQEIEEDAQELKSFQKYAGLREKLNAAEKFQKDLDLEEMEKEMQENRSQFGARKRQLEKDIKEKTSQIKNIERKIDPTLKDSLVQIQDEIKKKNLQLEKVADRKNILLQEKIRLETLSESFKDLEKKIQEEKRRLRKIDVAAENYSLLTRAFGKDGIQALEIDAAGPEITDIANTLLKESFGELFTIAFRTTRRSKDGKKVLEDFGIDVWWKGVQTPLEDLSGGEKVWVQEAIREAIFVYQKKTSHAVGIRTAFLDESDGALDQQSRRDFFLMVDNMRRMSDLHHLFIVTQDPEIQTSVGSQLAFKKSRDLEKIHFTF